MGESEGEKEDEPKVEEEEEELGMQNSMNIFFFLLSVLNINSGVIFVVFFFRHLNYLYIISYFLLFLSISARKMSIKIGKLPPVDPEGL